MAQDKEEPAFTTALQAALVVFGLPELPDSQAEKLARHFALVRSWNPRMNLTRIADPEDVAQFHYAESIFAAQFIADARNIIDIGSGAGFPAVPFAVVRPDLHVTALEANQKKCVFLKEVKDALGLDNLEVVRARIEEYDWSDCELITARALDRAEEIVPRITRGLSSGQGSRPGLRQRLLLFSTEKLVEAIRKDVGVVGSGEGVAGRVDGVVGNAGRRGLVIELHHIPGSRERLVALISSGA